MYARNVVTSSVTSFSLGLQHRLNEGFALTFFRSTLPNYSVSLSFFYFLIYFPFVRSSVRSVSLSCCLSLLLLLFLSFLISFVLYPPPPPPPPYLSAFSSFLFPFFSFVQIVGITGIMKRKYCLRLLLPVTEFLFLFVCSFFVRSFVLFACQFVLL